MGYIKVKPKAFCGLFVGGQAKHVCRHVWQGGPGTHGSVRALLYLVDMFET